jgi:L-asparaginase
MPALIIHGGAGRARDRTGRDAIRQSLADIAQQAWTMILNGSHARAVAVEAARLLEDDPLFNAGLGSKLQSDGGARLSAALMDGELERFSGVINVEGLLNPILLCEHLQTARDRVLAGAGALDRARALGLPEGNVKTASAIENWHRAREGETGTIGAVVCDTAGRIAAATSTGGRGMEAVGRVSDSATVAGNFATPRAGVSCTGIGEDIVDGALAARLVSAVDAGTPLDQAASMLEAKMRARDWSAGLIALDAHDSWSAIHTTEVMYWTAVDAKGVHQFSFPDLP